MATDTTTEQTLTEYRVAMIEELGFAHDEAEKLSNTMYDKTLSTHNGVKQTYHIRTDHHFVRQMLKGGATRQQVLDILT